MNAIDVSFAARFTAPPRRVRREPRGFTLVELLTVVAIIGLLAAILIPTTTSARVAVKRARTKVQFSQWSGAMDQFRQEYGYYPAIDGGTGKVVPELFSAALAGQSLSGASEVPTDQLGGNARRIRFYAVAEGELDENRTALCDAFGNTDLAVLCDRSGDGRITAADGEARAVAARGSGRAFRPTAADLNLAVGLRAGVIFYSAGNGATQEDLVLSWR